VCLLSESLANGGLQDQDGKPWGLGSTDVEIWLKIKHKWVLKNGKWFSEKLEEVRAARVEFKKRQSEKGILSAKKRKSQSTKPQPNIHHGSTNVEPIESECEKEIEFKLKESFDEIYLEQESMKWQHIDFKFEYLAFCNKVRGSPDHYQNHESSGMRLAFQSQLRNAKKKVNGTYKSKQQQNTDSLIEDYAKRHGTAINGQADG